VARVFVSYASQDRECAGQLHQWLVAEGHEVFLDRDPGNGIAVGEEWDKRLHERLRWADAVVCVVTSASVASTWCTAEISIALSRGSRVLPVLAEPRVGHPLLPGTQHADLTIDAAAGRAALVAALRRVDAVGGLGWPDDRSPFPGLRPFDVDEHRVFCGRSGEVERLAGLVRSPAERAEGAVLLVVGPSGCGKSSLVRAGLVHVMASEPGWCALAPMLPGADPVAALARELTAAAQRLSLDWTVAGVRHRLDDTGLTGLADELLLAARARRLLVVVDQCEELLTQTGPAQRAHFARLVHPALSGPVQVVATLRPEFLDQLLLDADLAVLPTHPFVLRPLHREALRAVIEGPARLAGIGVDEDLVARLVADTDTGESLPLLAFTLAQLAEGVGRGGQLSVARYEQLGGVQGALTRQADAALAEASAVTGRGREQVIAGLLRLVTVDEQGRPTRWRVPRDELPEPVTRELDVFIARRLLTTDTHNGTVVIGVAHEAFLTAWPPLAQAIEANASALRARRALEQAATEWHDNGRPPGRLWERGQLAAALADTGAHVKASNLITDRVDLSRTAREFLRTSIRREQFRRRRTITAFSVLLVLALAAASIALVQRRTAAQQRNVAVSRQVASQALEFRDANSALAAQLGLAAYRLAPTIEARSSLLSTVANPDATRLNAHTNSVKGVALSSDGRVLATGSDDHTARLWDISNFHRPRPLGALTGHTNYVSSVAFSPGGRVLATGSDDHTARLWDISDPQHPTLLGSLTGHTDVVYSVAFSPNGRILATTSADRTARLWDVSDPRQPHMLSTFTGSPPNEVNSVAFSPDGHILASASQDTTVRLWEVSEPRQPHPFSPDGHILATAGDDRTARLWDVNDPHHPSLLGTLTGHTGRINGVAFSPDGRTLATGSDDRTAWLWDISDPHHPSLLGILTGHTGSVNGVAFSPDGHTLATGSADRTTRLWDISNLRHLSLLGILTGHTDIVFSVAFGSDGHTLATGSADSIARLWETDVDSAAARICRITPTITPSEWDQYFPGLPYRPPCP
jgi:WD40 repeat protein/energy-coupling factor transporter ATP-binding protein EcfA2